MTTDIEPEGPFSKKNRDAFTEPIVTNNPITIQVLGICSSLAITTALKPSLVMAVAVTVVITFSNIIISLLRKHIPHQVRIIVEMTVIATLVILVDEFLRAYAYDVSKQLSVFVGLIITNCIVLGRLEAFALGNRPWPSLLDGLGNGIGYGLVLVIVGIGREITGAGKIAGIKLTEIPLVGREIAKLYDYGYMDNSLMLLAPGAFIILGLLVWLQRSLTGYEEEN